MVAVLATVNFSVAAVNMDVNTPNASVHVGTPPPAPQVILVGQERGGHDDRHDFKKDNGKHKGQMKHKKHKKGRDEGKHKHHD